MHNTEKSIRYKLTPGPDIICIDKKYLQAMIAMVALSSVCPHLLEVTQVTPTYFQFFSPGTGLHVRYCVCVTVPNFGFVCA